MKCVQYGCFFFFQAEDGIRDTSVTGVQTCALPICQFEIDPAVVKLVPADTAQKYQIVPLSRAGATLTIAMTDPTNVFAMDDIKFMTGYNVEPVVASETAVTDAITRYYPANAPAARVAAEPKKKREVAAPQVAN